MYNIIAFKKNGKEDFSNFKIYYQKLIAFILLDH